MGLYGTGSPGVHPVPGRAMIRDMTSVPDRARVRLTGISSRAYEHPADRSALVALRKLTGFDVLLRKLFGLFNERAFRLTYLASAVRVSERQFPHIYELARDGSYILDLPDAARRALMKLAGGAQLSELNPDAFREQAHEYDAVPDLRDSILKIMQLQGNTHPFAVVRFAELDYWATHGEYERILGGDYLRRDTDANASVGEEIRNAAKSYQESGNRSQDPLIGIFPGVAERAARAGGAPFDRPPNRRRG